MTKLSGHLRSFVARQKFDPTPIGIVIHPFYIIRSRLRRAIAAAAPAITGRVLDFGCGSKPYRMLFDRADSYIGLDVAVSGHSHAHSHIDVFYDGKTVPFDAASFDAVVSFEVFEHVFNLDEILGELHRVLATDGCLLFSAPFAWPEHEQPFDCGRYTTFGLTEILRRNGFRVEVMVRTTGDVEAIAQLWTGYLHERFAPRNAVLRALFQLIVIAPWTVAGLIAGRLLPPAGSFYCNLVVRAQRT